MSRGICENEKTSYKRAWYVGDRTGIMKEIVDAYKFEYAYEAHQTLADLLSATLGVLPRSATLVPLPTIPSHKRQRGYDHTQLLARALAKQQEVVSRSLLKRNANTVQRGASRAMRFKQAEDAFKAPRRLRGGLYILVDDIVTTGASLEYAARALLASGADEVWAAVVARHPLD